MVLLPRQFFRLYRFRYRHVIGSLFEMLIEAVFALTALKPESADAGSSRPWSLPSAWMPAFFGMAKAVMIKLTTGAGDNIIVCLAS